MSAVVLAGGLMAVTTTAAGQAEPKKAAMGKGQKIKNAMGAINVST